MDLSRITDEHLTGIREERTKLLNEALQEARRRADSHITSMLRECFAKLEEGL